MRTIAIINQKGGCGKTTTAINLAACLADQKKRVLLIDMDPQSHASLGLNLKTKELELSLYDVLLAAGDQDGPRLEDIAVELTDHLALVPSNIVLSAFEQKLSGSPGRESRLLQAIERMPKTYDYILIDCPPSVGLLSFNALRAAQDALIPIEPSFFSLHGLGKQIEAIQLFSEKLGHHIEIRTLVTMFDRRTRIAREVLEEVRKHFGRQTLQTVIHYNVRLKEAASYGSAIAEFDKHCAGYRDYCALSRELAALESPAAVAAHRPDFTEGPKPVRNGILFSFHAPDVQSLKLVGDFNNWTPDRSAELAKGEGGVWEKVVPLPPGKYHYKYIVDGAWKADPANPRNVVNDFGGIDSVIEVAAYEFPALMKPEESQRPHNA